MEAGGIRTLSSFGVTKGGADGVFKRSETMQALIDRDKGSNFSFGETEAVKQVEKVELEVTKVVMVILATSFGRTIAKDIVATGTRAHLVQSVPGEPAHVTKPLIEIHMVPVINYWLQQLRRVPRLTPIERKVYIVCNASNYHEFVSWAKDPKRCGLAGGFPVDHIFNNGATSNDGAHMGHVRDLALFADRSGWKDEHVLVLEGDYLVNPDWSMNAAVEHSIIRGKDTIGRHRYLGSGPAKGPRHLVRIEDDGPAVMPRITAIESSPSLGMEDSSTIAGPLYFLRRTTIPLIKTWLQDPGNLGVSPEAALGHFLSWLVKTVPVYALDVPHVLDVLAMRDVMFADGLFEYMARRKKQMLELTRVSDTDSSLDFKTDFSGNQAKKIASHAERERSVETFVTVEEAGIAARQVRGVGEVTLDMDEVVASFNERFERYMESRLQSERDSRLPMRFADASLYSHKPRGQHPCYVTTSNEYGRKKPSQQQMPMSWSGIKGLFSKTYHPNPYHDTGFNTFTTTSKVHAVFDEF